MKYSLCKYSMTPQTIELLKADLVRDEGVRLDIYLDTLRLPTVGIGHLIVAGDPEHGKPVGTKITKARCDELFVHDVHRTLSELQASIPWILEQPEDVQRGLMNMAFQLGIRGLLDFRNTLMYVRRREYGVAKSNALQSLWARQTPARANRVWTLIVNAR